MVQASPRASVRGPTFVRLLARLTDADLPPSSASLTDRLSQWLDWTQAIALSTALDGRPATDAGAPPFGSAEEEECARLRAALAHAITSDATLAPGRPRDADEGADEDESATPDFAPFRQRCLGLQRSMQAATGRLRGRLRDMLADQSAEKARLAAVDAVMEQSLSPREYALLGAVPRLLEGHFERLRRRAQAQASPDAWLDTFRQDVQSVLLAELDVRFQPVDALLAALRTR